MQAAAQPLLWQHSMQSAMEVVRCKSAILSAASLAMLSAGPHTGIGRTDQRNQVSCTACSASLGAALRCGIPGCRFEPVWHARVPVRHLKVE